MVETGTKTPGRKRGRPTETERAQRRDDILDASVRLFVAEGFEPVTLDRIAAEAHVTKRTIYSYLGDRTDLFLAAVDRLAERTLREADSVHELERLATAIVRTLHSDDAVGLHRLVITESRRFPDLAERFYREGPQRYIDALRAALPDVDPPRREKLADALFSLLLGEPHRKRLLGLASEPDSEWPAAHARGVLALLQVMSFEEGSRA
ncbi:TetR/AcrR family transcriptional regulator [Microbacterium testaceum]|uniref:TetR/AcrR family transcriptional regulator n=1 Tax=Microbacterium testaceum TaxID=2033 RepID=UPI003416D0A7